MLAIKNLTKTYSSKGSVTVKALDDVSVTFPETGMVFLLGKSGSGKSTLLNICGGLDTPDVGEIIIGGKSSKTFSGSDFDSYRNTFVGFIFQEYNILDEFTVEENLSLALELQGKNKNKKRVNELLEQVDLQGFARRKPNTLSGGQKQRVAIARALIKDPKIIMADEPTGALDSNTGKQVLETLKKLSLTRLVIVVSHDRESAKNYGDRIIELKDGKIIADETKEKIAAKTLSENISVIGDNTLSVKSGGKLSATDMAKIQKFLLETEGNVILSKSEREISLFKQANCIDENGASECFEPTVAEKIPVRQYNAEETKLVKSKLPLRKAARIGASSLKVKPIRLIFTILLSVVAFTFFGIFSTLMTYNQMNVLAKSYADSYYNAIALKKQYQYTETYYEKGEKVDSRIRTNETYFSPADIVSLQNQFGADVLGVVSFQNVHSENNWQPQNIHAISADGKNSVFTKGLTGFAIANKNSSYRNEKMLYGKYPEKKNEIAIGQWYFKMLQSCEFYAITASDENFIGYDYKKSEEGQNISLANEQDIIGKYICFGCNGLYVTLKVTGVYDEGSVPTVYEEWEDFSKIKTWDIMKQSQYEQYLSDTLHLIALTDESFIEEYLSITDWSNIDVYQNSYFSYCKYYSCSETGKMQAGFNSAQIYDAAKKDMLPVVWFGDEKQKLYKGEVIISLDMLRRLEWNYYSELCDNDDSADRIAAINENWREKYFAKYDARKQKYEALIDEYYKKMQTADAADAEKYQTLINDYSTLVSFYQNASNGCFINNYDIFLIAADRLSSGGNYFNNTSVYTEEEKKADTELLVAFINDVYKNKTLTFECSDDQYLLILDAVGFYVEPSINEQGVYLSKDDYPRVRYDYYSETATSFVLTSDSIYSKVYLPFDKTENGFKKISAVTKVVAEDDGLFDLDNSLGNNISYVNNMVEMLRNVFLYVGLVFAVFAALLLFNFISVSIIDKTHEIGVLRAVGARGWDVFKIFFAESAIIVCICLIISVGAAIGTISYLNTVLTEALGFSYSLFVFGGISLIMMLGVAAVVAFLGTFLPVFRIARKKPVESMRKM